MASSTEKNENKEPPSKPLIPVKAYNPKLAALRIKSAVNSVNPDDPDEPVRYIFSKSFLFDMFCWYEDLTVSHS